MTKIEDSPIAQKKHCPKCEKDVRALLVRKIMASYGTHYAWFCPACQRYMNANGSLWIGASKVLPVLESKSLDVEDIPIVDFSCGERCAKCGSRGTELHHWAPRAIFDDADDWPMDYLCKPCHDAWHRVMSDHLATTAADQGSEGGYGPQGPIDEI